MVKIIGAVMTGFASAYIGFRMRRTLRVREQSLSDICASLEILEGEIGFGMNKLAKALMRSDRCGLFKTAAEMTDTLGGSDALRCAVKSQRNRLCLTDADCSVLMTLAQNIGRTDTDTQLKNIRYAKASLASLQRDAARDYARLGRLCSGGGILAGAMIIILLI